MPIMILSSRLGYSSPALTLNVYSHALPTTDQSETKRVAAALDRAETPVTSSRFLQTDSGRRRGGPEEPPPACTAFVAGTGFEPVTSGL